MLARRTASAAAASSVRSAPQLSQFHTSGPANNNNASNDVPGEGVSRTPLSSTDDREARMKQYLAARQAYSGEFRPAFQQYQGMSQRMAPPTPQQRPIQLPNQLFQKQAGGQFNSGNAGQQLFRSPQVMKGPPGQYPAAYQPRQQFTPQQPQFPPQHFPRQQVPPQQQQFPPQQFRQQVPPQQQQFPPQQFRQQVPPQQQQFSPQQFRQQVPPQQQQFSSQHLRQQVPPQQQQQFSQQQQQQQLPPRNQYSSQPQHQGEPQEPTRSGGVAITRSYNSSQQPSQQGMPSRGQTPMTQPMRLPLVQPGGFTIRRHESSPMQLYQKAGIQPSPPVQQDISGAWGEAISSVQPIGSNRPMQMRIRRTRQDPSPQNGPQARPNPNVNPTQQSPFQQQTPISDAPPTREAGSFSFNSSPNAAPRALRRPGATRAPAVNWDKPRQSPSSSQKPAPRLRTTSRGNKKSDIQPPPQQRSIEYTPTTPTPEALFPDIPSTLLTPLGQSRILASALPKFHKNQSTWTSEDWEKYDEKREAIKRKWINGERYQWDWSASGGVDGVQNGGVALDTVRRMVSLNKSYDFKGKRIIMDALWNRLPKPLLAAPGVGKGVAGLPAPERGEVRA